MTEAILQEFALIPDIFDPACYSDPVLADALLPTLKQPLYQQALVRDLSNGAWSRHCQQNAGSLHRMTKELLRKLKLQNRLVPTAAHASATPATAEQWCHEAMLSHAASPLNGIICAADTKVVFKKNSEIASIEALNSTQWWHTGHASSILDRKTADYRLALSRVLRQANLFMFIDPYLDPSEGNYRDFHQLLAPLQARNPKPRIEIHRSFCRGSGQGRCFPSQAEWQTAFRSLDTALDRAGLSAEVFCWQDFHDRHLITDIVGILAGAGFDTTGKPQDMTTWSCLSRDDL